MMQLRFPNPEVRRIHNSLSSKLLGASKRPLLLLSEFGPYAKVHSPPASHSLSRLFFSPISIAFYQNPFHSSFDHDQILFDSNLERVSNRD